jgi:hypothetical protein
VEVIIHHPSPIVHYLSSLQRTHLPALAFVPTCRTHFPLPVKPCKGSLKDTAWLRILGFPTQTGHCPKPLNEPLIERTHTTFVPPPIPLLLAASMLPQLAVECVS